MLQQCRPIFSDLRDLMAKAGVPYRVGREGSSEHAEWLAGYRPESGDERMQFAVDVSGLDEHGNRLPNVQPAGEKGYGDNKISAYNIRPCMTRDPANRVPIGRPAVFEESDYEILFRYLEASPNLSLDKLLLFAEIPNRKFDVNNFGPVSTNLIGGSWSYPEASYEERRTIYERHRNYVHGLFYSLGNHQRVPPAVRKEMAEWGLCADEFRSNSYWPPQLYVREARRMIGRYVMSQRDILNDYRKEDSIGIGDHYIESHHVQRYVNSKGLLRNEGHISFRRFDAYEIPYGSIIPKAEHCSNLLVPVALSASHIAFSSLRMEPVFMVLGQSAASAAAEAMRDSSDVQSIDIGQLQRSLRSQKQVIKL